MKHAQNVTVLFLRSAKDALIYTELMTLELVPRLAIF